MAKKNSFRNPIDDAVPQEEPQAKRSVFSWLDAILNLENLLQSRRNINYIPYLLFITAIGIFYIGNNHQATKTQRQLMQLEQEVTNIKTDYTTLQAKYMMTTRQSEVEKRAEKLGLKAPKKPPYQIQLEK
jgi:cell division protein FtsL